MFPQRANGRLHGNQHPLIVVYGGNGGGWGTFIVVYGGNGGGWGTFIVVYGGNSGGWGTCGILNGDPSNFNTTTEQNTVGILFLRGVEVTETVACSSRSPRW